jgi:hypothetical protein
MARRNGTVCLSASISSSAHHQLIVERLHNNHYISSMANRLSFSMESILTVARTLVCACVISLGPRGLMVFEN